MTTTPTSGAADLLAMVSKALREAYYLGQRYWQQADSEYISQHKKADDTRAKFLALVEETCAALAAGQATAAPAQPATQQGAAYAALPAHGHAGRVYEEGFLIGTCPLYTADQMRSFADATYMLRASHGQASAPADSVQEDAALWHWLAEYLVGTRTDLDDEIVASETVNDLRKLVEAARKQGGAT